MIVSAGRLFHFCVLWPDTYPSSKRKLLELTVGPLQPQPFQGQSVLPQARLKEEVLAQFGAHARSAELTEDLLLGCF